MGNRIKVYIIADNIISALGFGTGENVEAIRNYRTGIRMHTDNRVADVPTQAGLIDDSRLYEHVVINKLQAYTRAEQLSILSIQDVLTQSGTDMCDSRCGFIFASTKGNIELLRHHTGIQPDEVSLWRMAEKVAGYFGRESDCQLISNACISGLSALIVAKRWIECGRYDRVVVAGVDVLSHFITSGFSSFKSVSQNICRPYDAAHDGLNLGEGCATILLSREGLAHNDVILAGGAISNDANHLSGPSRTGDGLYLAINGAMLEAGLNASDIDTVNAHGTATVYNDEMESKAIHLAGLHHAPVNSFKSYFGHTLGAAGVIETIICAYELKEQIIFGTYGFSEPGVPMPLNLSANHVYQPLSNCIKTASGFGGCNAAIALLVSKKPEVVDNIIIPDKITTRTLATVVIENNTVIKDNKLLFQSADNDFHSFIRQAYKEAGGTNLKFYQSSELCKLGSVAAMYLLDELTFKPEDMGIIMANADSSLLTDMAHQHIIDNSGDSAASPAVFVYTLPNVVTGQICINHKIQGENTFFINKTCNFGELENYARLVMERTGLRYCIVGWCNAIKDKYRAELKLIYKDKSENHG